MWMYHDLLFTYTLWEGNIPISKQIYISNGTSQEWEYVGQGDALRKLFEAQRSISASLRA